MTQKKEAAHPTKNAQLDTRNTNSENTPLTSGFKSIEVSFSDGAKTNALRRDVTIGYLLESIRTGGKGGMLRQQVEAIRDKQHHGDKNAKKLACELKLQLPAVTFSGTFTERRNGALTQHSGLICADL